MSDDKIIKVKDVATALGWSRARVRRMLCNAGVVRKVGKFWVTSPGILACAFPEMHEAILDRLADVDDPDPDADCAKCDEMRQRIIALIRENDSLRNERGLMRR